MWSSAVRRRWKCRCVGFDSLMTLFERTTCVDGLNGNTVFVYVQAVVYGSLYYWIDEIHDIVIYVIYRSDI